MLYPGVAELFLFVEREAAIGEENFEIERTVQAQHFPRAQCIRHHFAYKTFASHVPEHEKLFVQLGDVIGNSAEHDRRFDPLPIWAPLADARADLVKFLACRRPTGVVAPMLHLGLGLRWVVSSIA
jgi:hypothetical protein